MKATTPPFQLNIPLSLRFLLFAVVILIVNGLIMSSQTDSVMEKAFLSETGQQIGMMLQRMGREIQQGRLQPSDTSLAQEAASINQSQQRMELLALYLFDGQGRVLAHSKGDHTPKVIEGAYAKVIKQHQPSLGTKYEWDAAHATVKSDYVIPVKLDSGETLGLEAEVNLTGIKQAINRFDGPFEHSMWFSILLSSILMLIVIGSLIYLRLTGPIARMHKAVKAMSEGELDTRVSVKQHDELGELGDGINHLAQSVQALLAEQEESYLQTLRSLAQALEAKDPYTAAHSGRVSRYAVRLGQRIGLPKEDLSLLKRGALMHDLGKIGIPDAILNKPAALDPHEYEEMCRHPVMTASIMKPLSRFRAFAEIAAWHHERWDGGGYPDGLKGEEIPLLARIVAIADAWDAMTGDRVYRKGMSTEKALSILEAEINDGQFEPRLITTFIAMIREDLRVEEGQEYLVEQ